MHEICFLWSENYMDFMAEVPTQNLHLMGVEKQLKSKIGFRLRENECGKSP